MTVYARSDVMGVIDPFTGDMHERKVEKKATKTEDAVYASDFALNASPDFEQWLIDTFPDQWSRRADKVPPTPDEILDAEAAAREGTILTGQMARAMAEAAAQAVVAAGQAG